MQTGNLIAAEAFCAGHQIELSFIRTLHESGLIDMTMQEGIVWLQADELSTLEKFVRWHYELSINPEGIEALAHLLFRVDHMQEEIRTLRNRLRNYDPPTRDTFSGPPDEC
ncbi:MAG TPA: chaperone modulator CbpM [Puia sp.]|nr:chaperone modulator CbpM [Puia sp.]